MMMKLVDHRVSPDAGGMAFLAAALDPAGVLNVSGCSHHAATTALAGSSQRSIARAPARRAAETGARPATAVRELDPAPSGMQTDDAFERFDHLPIGASS
jgi:hypothetical protein